MRWSTVACGAALMLVPARASAYTVGTPVTGGCHELITTQAMGAARAASPSAAPLPLVTSDDQAILGDLPFAIDPTMSDLGGMSLILGVRDNDLKGLSPTDLAALAIEQSNPSTQDQHCLRSLQDVEPDGTPDALSQCRAYILGRVAAALDYLTSDGNPDPDGRVGLKVGLAIRGPVTVQLPGFYVYMGQALHALEDSFSHSYRDVDSGAVTASLTWLHVVDDDLNQSVDGPPHSAELDECSSLDSLRQQRMAAAEAAATQLLLAAVGPGSTQERIASAGTVLDQALAYESGCTDSNGWCNAPERAYSIELVGCAIGRRGAGVVAVLLVIALGLLLRRRRRLAATLTVATVLAAGSDARADGAAATAEESMPRSPFGAYATFGGSLDHTALEASLAGRFRIDPRWLVGLDVEYNPWFSVLGPGGVKPGALNVYATGIRRWPIHSEKFDLRTSAHAGTSTILFDLYGVPKGSTGVYVGVSLLAIEWKVARAWSLVFEPSDIAFPVPQLRATPFGYLQYRFTFGVQWGA
jgi:hypothetical protein